MILFATTIGLVDVELSISHFEPEVLSTILPGLLANGAKRGGRNYESGVSII